MSSTTVHTPQTLGEEQQSSAHNAPINWIYNPYIDLIVGCSLWSLPLLLLANRNSIWIPITFYALSIFINNPHYMATVYRAYRNREDFSKYQFFALHITLLLVITAAFIHWQKWALTFFYTIYINWSPWHYAGQNYGLGIMFARRNGITPTKGERNSFYLSFLFSFIVILLSFHSDAATDPFVLSLGIPFKYVKILIYLFSGLFAITGLWSLWRMTRQVNLKAMLPTLALFATQIIWFVAPTLYQVTTGIQISQASYSTGILAFAHSTQYLWITSYFAKQEANKNGATNWKPGKYFAILVLGGLALFLPLPWMASYLFHIDYTTSFLITVALVNIHHFMMDGVIWKLRDKKIAALLIDIKDKGLKTTEQAGVTIFSALDWFTSARPLPRVVRIVAILLLLSLAALDQTRYFFKSNINKLDSLVRADQINPYDGFVKASIAQEYLAQNNKEAAISFYSKAIALEPYEADWQKDLARLFIETGQYEQALSHYQQMFKHLNADASSLLNYGLLVSQMGQYEVAEQCWQKALSLDANQPLAHLYLADSLSKRNNFADAIPHYEQYIAIVSADPAKYKIAPNNIIYIAIKLAECYRIENKIDTALLYYQQSLKLATQANDITLQSLANSSMASIYVSLGDRTRGIKFYQEAIKLNEQTKDNKTIAEDLFNYGQLLIINTADQKYALACLLKAKALLTQLQNEAKNEEDRRIIGNILDTINKSTEEVQTKETINDQDLDKVIKESLQLNN